MFICKKKSDSTMAIRFDGDNIKECEEFINGKIESINSTTFEYRMYIKKHYVGNICIGDYILKENNGFIHLIDSEFFDLLYEKISKAANIENNLKDSCLNNNIIYEQIVGDYKTKITGNYKQIYNLLEMINKDNNKLNDCNLENFKITIDGKDVVESIENNDKSSGN